MATNPELFRPEYLTRLPLPLAQVYYRAFNAKDSRGQHDNALFVFEASVRLAVVVAILDYCSRVKRGAPHERTVDDLLARFSRPSQGHWVAMLRGLARHFGEQPMPPWNPLGLLWGQITTPRDDLPSILSLYRRVKNGPDGRPAGDRNCSLVQLFEALASYRTGVLGHGGNRRDEFYDEMARLLRSAASELLAEGVFDLLGPAGSQLIYFEEALHIRAGETAHANLLSLTGTLSQRVRFELLATSEPLEFSADQLAVLRSGDSAPLGLDPLLILRKDGLVDEVMFFNSLRRRDQMEYLSYTSGRMERVTVSESAVAKVIGLGEDQESPAKSFKYRFVRFGTHFVSAPGVRDNPGDEPAALHENELAVDVGDVCWGLDDETLSVLDHHFRRTDGQFPSAAAAVLHNAKRIHERFAGRDGEIWLVSHQKPDFDAFCAMYLARQIIAGNLPAGGWEQFGILQDSFQPGGAPAIDWFAPRTNDFPVERRWPVLLAACAACIDNARRMSCPKHRSLQWILYAALHRGRNYLDVSSGALEFFDEVRRALLTPLRQLNPLLDDVLAGSERFSPELELLDRELEAYRRDIARARKSIVRLQSSTVAFREWFREVSNRPLFSNTGEPDAMHFHPPHQSYTRADGIYLRDPQCLFFKEWVGDDLDNSPMRNGFLFTALAYSDQLQGAPVNSTAYYFALHSERAGQRHLYNVWARLQAAEIAEFKRPENAALWKRLKEADDQATSEFMQRTTCRSGYSDRSGLELRHCFDDPWFDGNNYNCTIIMSPSRGTLIGPPGQQSNLADDPVARIVQQELEQPIAGFAEPIAAETIAARGTLETVNEAYSSQTVVVHYPEPIAVAYQRFCQREEAAERLLGLLSAVEMMMRYLVTLGVSDLMQCLAHSGKDRPGLPPDPDHEFDFLRYPSKMLLGHWPKALRYAARLLAAPEFDGRRYIEEFPRVCRPGGILDEALLGKLVSERNCVIHAKGCHAWSGSECRKIFAECLPLVDQALEEIRFVRSYPLAFVEPIPGPATASATDANRFFVHGCQGTGPSRRRFVLESTLDLLSDWPFVVTPGKERLLYLWPLMAVFVDPHAAHPTLHIFEEIPGDAHLFLSEIRYAAIDGRELTEPKTLHREEVQDHAWLIERLGKVAMAEEGKVDAELWRKLARSRDAKLEGKQLGPNFLEKAVGRGGFGTIYAARAADGKQVAVKVLESDLLLRTDWDKQFARFQQEFDKLKKAHEQGRHPGIIQCYQLGFDPVAGESDYYYWYSMEFAMGDLTRRIDDRNQRRSAAKEVPWKEEPMRQEIIREFDAIAGAVAHLHGLDIIHRDIKPSNVLIMGDDGTLRLSDFGLVKNLNPTITSRLRRPKSMTGAVQGTWQYMAPEQRRAKKDITKAADVYSLGLLLAELATGRLPKRNIPKPAPKKNSDRPRDSTDIELDHGTALNGSDPNLRQLPPALRDFLFECTDRDPTRRPKDGQAVHDRFRELVTKGLIS